MEYIENKDVVLLFDKQIGLDALASKLALLNGEQTKSFFMSREIKIPRRINSMALTSALNERIKTLDSHSLTRDAFIKLESYATFTEFQLQNLFEKIATADDFFLYRKNLWKVLIRNHIGIKLQDGELIHLMNMRKTKIDSFTSYSKAIFSVTLDLTKEFDGCPIQKLDTVLKENFSLEELRLLADKYNFNIPSRLKKDDLLKYVREMMKAKRKLTLALQRELNNMTLVQLNEFATLQGLGISSNLKKEEMVSLMIFLVKQAGFTSIDAKQILGMSFTEPLKFRIDLDAVDNFKRGLPKKVIYLDENEIKSFHQLDEYVEEAVAKTNSKDDLIFEILKKLLPYLNVDEQTAQVAIHKGIEMPEPVKKKAPAKKTVTEEKLEVKVKTPAKTKASPEPQNDLLEEIIKKVRKLREKDKLEEEKAKIAKKRAIFDENIDDLLAEFDDNEEYDDLDFEPVEDNVAERSLEEVYSELQRTTLVQEEKIHEFKQEEKIIEEVKLEEELLTDIEEAETTTLSAEPEPILEVEELPSLEETIKELEEKNTEEQALEAIEVEPLTEEIPSEPQNESYDEVFLKEEGIIQNSEAMLTEKENALIPIGPLVDLSKQEEPIQDFIPLDNPYYENKKMNFKWRPILLTLGTFALIFVVCISIMAVLNAFK